MAINYDDVREVPNLMKDEYFEEDIVDVLMNNDYSKKRKGYKDEVTLLK